MDKMELKALVKSFKGLQKLRVQTGLRLMTTFKLKLGQGPSEKEETLDKESKDILEELRLSYNRITDGILDPNKLLRKRKFKGEGYITTDAEFALVRNYIFLKEQEEEQLKNIGRFIKTFLIYTQFLEKVSGIGPAIAAMIISEIDISKAKYASSVWKYCGLDVVMVENEKGELVGEGRSRRAAHLIDVPYIDRNGKEKTKKSITFNPDIKTTLIGIMGPSFLKRKDKNPYTKVYYQYKHRLENHAVYKNTTDLHRHNMAIRKMVKRFLVDLYIVWREIEGLEVHPEYSEAKLGMKHGAEAA